MNQTQHVGWGLTPLRRRGGLPHRPLGVSYLVGQAPPYDSYPLKVCTTSITPLPVTIPLDILF